jgi:hypothetical protein
LPLSQGFRYLSDKPRTTLLRPNPGTGTHFALPLARGRLFGRATLALLAAAAQVAAVQVAVAQVPPRLPPAPTPNFNPSSPLVVPQAPPVPVSPVTPGTLPESMPSDANVSGSYSIMAPEQRAGKAARHERRRRVHHHPPVKPRGR